jgi:hypothetical protein
MRDVLWAFLLVSVAMTLVAGFRLGRRVTGVGSTIQHRRRHTSPSGLSGSLLSLATTKGATGSSGNAPGELLDESFFELAETEEKQEPKATGVLEVSCKG